MLIGDNSFSDCNNLAEVSLPVTLFLSKDSFSGCGALTHVTYTGLGEMQDYTWDNRADSPWYGNTTLRSVTFEPGITSIGAYIFCGCTGLKSIAIPQSVATIGRGAFHSSGIEIIELNSNLRKIEQYAFAFSGLTTVTISSNVEYISDTAFWGCDKLKRINFDGSRMELHNIIEDIRIDYDALFPNENIVYGRNFSEGSCGSAIRWMLTNDGRLTIAGSGEMNFSDTNSPWYAGRSFISDVDIAFGVTSIADFAFDCCGFLKTIHIPQSVTSIGVLVFPSCDSFENVYFDGSRLEWNQIFRYRDDSSVYPAELFFVKSKYESEYVDDNGDQIKWNVTNDGVLTISGHGIIDDPMLHGDKKISWWDGRDYITKLVIKDGVRAIYSSALGGMTRINEIYFEGDAPFIDYSAFYGIEATVYYPANRSGWNEAIKQDYGTAGNLTWVSYSATGVCDGGASCSGRIFSDMPAVIDWAHEGIDYCVEHSLMNGVGNGKFDPKGTLTRAMVVTVLWRQAGEPAAITPCMFTDLAVDWYKAAVAWAAETGVVNGRDAVTFDPDGAITRQEMATMLYRYAQNMGYDISQTADLLGFPDNGKVSTYAQAAMAWANASGIIKGDSVDGVNYLDPLSSATREQAAAILMRFCKNIAK